MKKFLLLLVSLILLLGCSSKQDLKKIGIVSLVEHTSLNIIKDSIMDELKNLGYVNGENCIIKFKNAQGDMSSLPTIMQNMKNDRVDVLIAITTPVAQSAISLTDNIPVVFSAVSDPVGAGILSDINDTSKNITGTSDPIKVDQIIDFALKTHNDTTKIGYIYNAGESNSITSLNKLENYSKNKSILIEKISITSSAEIQSAVSALSDKVDIIFVSNDNTIAEAMPILVNEALKYKIPVYTGADSMVMDGGFASVGIDYVDVGVETARMADKILNGVNTKDIKIELFDTKLNTYINKKTAEKLGFSIDDFKDIENLVIVGE
ncbi:MAG: ABC transporter substrate-binding protein [Erysipelotrichaceae bacterium]|nr:ABC transporter substrate-binding protein [Erysipelotrichaceae bacterium]